MINENDFILITGGSGFIGTNLIELFEEKGYNFINFDKSQPIKISQSKYWFKGDIMFPKTIDEAFEKYNPTVVIHLAARTDTLSDKLEDYNENTYGTLNIVNKILSSDKVRKAIFTSTQYVYKSNEIPFPQNDIDYKPLTTYGISKKISEEYVRNAELKCIWTIIRPCNVWGPWHMRYPLELWKIIAKGLYLHPSKSPVIRTYSYVKNLTHQLNNILNSERTVINKKTYYLGDNPIDSYIWLNTISTELTNKKIIRLPSFIFAFGSYIGDILRKLGVNFPLYTTRFKNMTEDYYAPSNLTVELFGYYNDNYKDNVKETITWLKNEGKEFFDFWEKFKYK